MDTLEVIKITTYILFIYLMLAIIVERIMEVLVSVYNYLEFRLSFYKYWTKKAKQYQNRYDRLYSYPGEEAPNTKRVYDWVLWKVISQKPYEGSREFISARMIRLNFVRFTTRLLAFGISLFIVITQKLDFISIVETMLPEFKVIAPITDLQIVRIIVSAAVIAIGTEPLHQLINKIENLEKKRKSKEVAE